jgi:phosphate/sulfate permease
MFGLDPLLVSLVIFCIACACAFEFVNGFHDTANAVATVIYTNTLKPITAVVWSGCWNFLGVLRGGVEVAMGIVFLLPLESLASANPLFSVAMVMALLVTAIFWNLGTWYFGIPCSSSHTLIGAIIGVGLAYKFMPINVNGADVNWSKATDIGLSLLLSPIIGFGLTIILLFIASKLIHNKEIFNEPNKQTKPPLWIRAILIITCTGVSYAHGNNDGQKGVGLMMVILIALVPLHFSLNQDADFKKTAIELQQMHLLLSEVDTTQMNPESVNKLNKIKPSILQTYSTLNSVSSINDLNKAKKLEIRSSLLKINKTISKLIKSNDIKASGLNLKSIKKLSNDSKILTDYAPVWVVLLISLSLGLGTMIGWKRIVVTIGEKIGKSHLTYAQGASAELVASTTIFAASSYGLPVSTTQVLTSAIAGSMTAKDGFINLQTSTLKNIGLAWILTLPICITMGAGLFWLFSLLVN